MVSMANRPDNKPNRHLFWVYTESLQKNLDSSTWIEATREIRNMGWTVTLVGVGDEGETTVRGVPVYNIPKPPVYFIRQAIFHVNVFRLLWPQFGSVDYLLFHQMSAPWMFLFRLTTLFRSRRPLLVMDTRTLPMADTKKGGLKDTVRERFYQLINRTAHLWVDGQLAITERIAQSIPIPPKNLWGIWPSGVKVEPLAAIRSQRRWPQSDEPIVLVYIGTLSHERRIDVFAKAVIRANELGMPFVFLMVGDGTARAELELLAAESGGVVRYGPPVPHEQVPQVLAQGHIGVLPFPDEEKFRVSSFIKLFEYLAAGLPMLATRIVAHTDVIGDAPYAFWAEDATVESFVEALKIAYSQREHFARLGDGAAAESINWTWQAAARKLVHGLEAKTYTKPLPQTVSFPLSDTSN
jgi:glycosyltransferase involved in cell wall biosynthesis